MRGVRYFSGQSATHPDRHLSGREPRRQQERTPVTVWLELPPNVPANVPVEVGFRLDRDGILEQVTVALKDGSGRLVEVYPDRGGERRSRLEKKLDQLHQEWVRKRLHAGPRRQPEIDELYGQAAEAANRQDLDTFEQILKEMETALRSRDDHWKCWHVDMLDYPLVALEKSGLLVRLEHVTSILPALPRPASGFKPRTTGSRSSSPRAPTIPRRAGTPGVPPAAGRPAPHSDRHLSRARIPSPAGTSCSSLSGSACAVGCPGTPLWRSASGSTAMASWTGSRCP